MQLPKSQYVQNHMKPHSERYQNTQIGCLHQLDMAQCYLYETQCVDYQISVAVEDIYVDISGWITIKDLAGGTGRNSAR